ncbi:MAG: DUF4097 family beta strand repeat protein [Nonomuraea sp.]|nr:DUF4097 family beta strand repeat protein [Nonomuraea sp.]
MRAAWLAAGAVATVFALVLSTLLLWHDFSRGRAPQEFHRRSVPFTQSELKITTGDSAVSVDINPGPAGTLMIDRSTLWTSVKKPTITEEWDGHTLRLDTRCETDEPDSACESRYTLFVPPEIDVDAATTFGDLTISDVIGGVRLTTVSGAVEAHRLPGSLWVRSVSGRLSVNSLSGGKVDVETGSGDVHVDFMDPPVEVRAVARATGSVDVRVPPGSYDVTAEGRHTDVDVDSVDGAKKKIEARAPLGNVRVAEG